MKFCNIHYSFFQNLGFSYIDGEIDKNLTSINHNRSINIY